MLKKIFLTFSLVGLIGFGGVMPFRDRIAGFFGFMGNNNQPAVTTPGILPSVFPTQGVPNRFEGLSQIEIYGILEQKGCAFQPLPVTQPNAPVENSRDGYALTDDFEPFSQANARFIEENILLQELGYPEQLDLAIQIKGFMADAIVRGISPQMLYTITEQVAGVTVSQSKQNHFDSSEGIVAVEPYLFSIGDTVASGFFLTQKHGKNFFAGSVTTVLFDLVKATSGKSCGYSPHEVLSALTAPGPEGQNYLDFYKKQVFR